MESLDIKRMFEKEVRDKRRTASGVHSRTGKRGYVGKMIMPTDIMSRKDKYNIRKGGKVFVYNKYERVMEYEEFLKLSHEEKYKTMIEYRRRHRNEDIRAKWGLSVYQYFTKLLKNELKITGRKKSNPPTVQKVEPVETPKETPVDAYLITEVKDMAKSVVRRELELQEQSEEVEGFNITINGKYSSEVIVSRLEKIMLLLSDEESDFEINLTLKEDTSN